LQEPVQDVLRLCSVNLHRVSNVLKINQLRCPPRAPFSARRDWPVLGIGNESFSNSFVVRTVSVIALTQAFRLVPNPDQTKRRRRPAAVPARKPSCLTGEFSRMSMCQIMMILQLAVELRQGDSNHAALRDFFSVDTRPPPYRKQLN
jgi:hypothetical protein